MKYVKPHTLYDGLSEINSKLTSIERRSEKWSVLLGLNIRPDFVGLAVSYYSRAQAYPIMPCKNHMDSVTRYFPGLISKHNLYGFVVGKPRLREMPSLREDTDKDVEKFIFDLCSTGKFKGLKYTYWGDLYASKDLIAIRCLDSIRSIIINNTWKTTREFRVTSIVTLTFGRHTYAIFLMWTKIIRMQMRILMQRSDIGWNDKFVLLLFPVLLVLYSLVFGLFTMIWFGNGSLFTSSPASRLIGDLRLLISNGGQWFGQNYEGGDSEMAFVPPDLTYDGLIKTMEDIVTFDSSSFSTELRAI
ncbi:hypothetical protein Dsin_004645 [Dipteronia sinensis]|uniref:Uncharacterized protein n=1 Tax=Dipteronia sinensis TaxID=43782 RepID=A0AAE0EDW1_9ROSI|nr:hypothetical protein Dsin_004645 [Dipteronia sinensis]